MLITIQGGIVVDQNELSVELLGLLIGKNSLLHVAQECRREVIDGRMRAGTNGEPSTWRKISYIGRTGAPVYAMARGEPTLWAGEPAILGTPRAFTVAAKNVSIPPPLPRGNAASE